MDSRRYPNAKDGNMTNTINYDLNNTINNMLIDSYSIWDSYRILADSNLTSEETRVEIEKITSLEETLEIKKSIVVEKMIYIAYNNGCIIDSTINNKRISWKRVVYKNYLIYEDGRFLYKNSSSGDSFERPHLSEFFPKNIFKWTDEHHTMFKLSYY